MSFRVGINGYANIERTEDGLKVTDADLGINGLFSATEIDQIGRLIAQKVLDQPHYEQLVEERAGEGLEKMIEYLEEYGRNNTIPLEVARAISDVREYDRLQQEIAAGQYQPLEFRDFSQDEDDYLELQALDCLENQKEFSDDQVQLGAIGQLDGEYTNQAFAADLITALTEIFGSDVSVEPIDLDEINEELKQDRGEDERF